MTVEEAKREYNEQLKRYEKAVKYFDTDSKDKEKFLPDFKILLSGLSQLLRIIKDYTQEEVWNGFK